MSKIGGESVGEGVESVMLTVSSAELSERDRAKYSIELSNKTFTKVLVHFIVKNKIGKKIR